MVIGAVQASFFIALLAAKKQKTQSDFLLMSYFLLSAIHLAYYYLVFHPTGDLPIEIGILGFSLVILHTPFFFLYVRSLVLPGRIRLSTISLHTLPYVLYNVVVFAASNLGWVKLSPEFGFLNVSDAKYAIFYSYGEPLAIVAVAYIIWGFYLLGIHRRYLSENASNLEHTKWLRFLVVSFLIYFLAIYISIEISDPAHAGGLIPVDVTFYVISFILMTYIFVIGYIGLRQTSIFIHGSVDTLAKPTMAKYAKSGLDTKSLERIQIELDDKMQQGKYYLDTDLTLGELASKLDLNPTYLSQVINQGFGVNFYDFVNKYRVNAAKEMLKTPENDHLSLLGIALDCGFKSKSTFNKFFKKYSGMTPREFKNNR